MGAQPALPDAERDEARRQKRREARSRNNRSKVYRPAGVLKTAPVPHPITCVRDALSTGERSLLQLATRWRGRREFAARYICRVNLETGNARHLRQLIDLGLVELWERKHPGNRRWTSPLASRRAVYLVLLPAARLWETWRETPSIGKDASGLMWGKGSSGGGVSGFLTPDELQYWRIEDPAQRRALLSGRYGRPKGVCG